MRITQPTIYILYILYKNVYFHNKKLMLSWNNVLKTTSGKPFVRVFEI